MVDSIVLEGISMLSYTFESRLKKSVPFFGLNFTGTYPDNFNSKNVTKTPYFEVIDSVTLAYNGSMYTCKATTSINFATIVYSVVVIPLPSSKMKLIFLGDYYSYNESLNLGTTTSTTITATEEVSPTVTASPTMGGSAGKGIFQTILIPCGSKCFFSFFFQALFMEVFSWSYLDF